MNKEQRIERIKQGILLNKAESAIRMLDKGMDNILIIAITQLSDVETRMLSALYNQFKSKAIDHIEIKDGKVCMK